MKKILGILSFGLIFMAVFLFSSINAEAYTHVSTLRLGVNNSQVFSLQQALNNAGFIISSSGAGSPGNETSYFGIRTKNAVVSFQKSKGLVADGIVGSKTGLALASRIVSYYPDGCTSDIGFSKTTGMPCNGGTDIGLIPTCPNYPTAAPLPPSIQVISPNGGQTWKTGEIYEIKWLACNAPEDSWVKLTYTVPVSFSSSMSASAFSTECMAIVTSPSSGKYSWKIPNYTSGCGDALSLLPSNVTFGTRIKAELYTGTPACEGLVPGDDPCVTGTRTLYASDESNSNFTISN